jgi:hypothetical protein
MPTSAAPIARSPFGSSRPRRALGLPGAGPADRLYTTELHRSLGGSVDLCSCYLHLKRALILPVFSFVSEEENLR